MCLRTNFTTDYPLQSIEFQIFSFIQISYGVFKWWMCLGHFNQSSRLHLPGHLDSAPTENYLVNDYRHDFLKKEKKRKEERKKIMNCNINTNETKIIFAVLHKRKKLKNKEEKCIFLLFFIFSISHMNYNKCLTFFHKMFKWQLLWLQYTIWSKALEDNSLFCKGHSPYIIVKVFERLTN